MLQAPCVRLQSPVSLPLGEEFFARAPTQLHSFDVGDLMPGASGFQMELEEASGDLQPLNLVAQATGGNAQVETPTRFSGSLTPQCRLSANSMSGGKASARQWSQSTAALANRPPSPLLLRCVSSTPPCSIPTHSAHVGMLISCLCIAWSCCTGEVGLVVLMPFVVVMMIMITMIKKMIMTTVDDES